MTRHKDRDERIEEILSAAAGEIEARGYAGLTMDAIVARTALSKGGVYRFFSNKRDVALALFRRVLRDLYYVDVPGAMSWNLPLKETLLRILFSEKKVLENFRNQRIWFDLLPETFHDREFRKLKEEEMRLFLENWSGLVRRLAGRDRIRFKKGINEKLKLIFHIAETFFQGLVLQKLMGTPIEELNAQLRIFLELMVNEALVTNTA